jgi:preprotein translocase subunit SecE
MSKYEHKLNDTELLEIMVGKTGNTTYIKEMNDELKKVTPASKRAALKLQLSNI